MVTTLFRLCLRGWEEQSPQMPFSFGHGCPTAQHKGTLQCTHMRDGSLTRPVGRWKSPLSLTIGDQQASKPLLGRHLMSKRFQKDHLECQSNGVNCLLLFHTEPEQGCILIHFSCMFVTLVLETCVSRPLMVRLNFLVHWSFQPPLHAHCNHL